MIKSYADLSQSKKLAEILPLESADMTYSALVEGMRDKMSIKDWEVTIGLDPAIKNNLFSYRNGYVFPCWSLAALLGVLPLINFTRPLLIGTPKTLYKCMYNDDLKSHAYDNPLDACVAMIIRLNELNLL